MGSLTILNLESCINFTVSLLHGIYGHMSWEQRRAYM